MSGCSAARIRARQATQLLLQRLLWQFTGVYVTLQGVLLDMALACPLSTCASVEGVLPLCCLTRGVLLQDHHKQYLTPHHLVGQCLMQRVMGPLTQYLPSVSPYIPSTHLTRKQAALLPNAWNDNMWQQVGEQATAAAASCGPRALCVSGCDACR